jgi:crotonobetainyl-CoA:carnitine CoA-transferase CaiB-like acyl-CoA transferase
MGLEHLAEDPRFNSRDQRTSNAELLHDMLDEIFLTQPGAHWVALLQEAGVPAGPVNTAAEMLEDPHVLARDMVVEPEHPLAGTVRVVGVPVKLSETPDSIRTPAPLLGEHTDEILTGLGLGSELAALHEAAIILWSERCQFCRMATTIRPSPMTRSSRRMPT